MSKLEASELSLAQEMFEGKASQQRLSFQPVTSNDGMDQTGK